MREWIRIVTLLMLPVLLLTFAVPPSAAQTAGDSTLNPVGSSDDDDDNTDEYVLVGLFAVVVGILVILGIRSDRQSWSHGKDAARYAALGEDADGALQGASLDGEESEMRVELTGMGLRARF